MRHSRIQPGSYITRWAGRACGANGKNRASCGRSVSGGSARWDGCARSSASAACPPCAARAEDEDAVGTHRPCPWSTGGCQRRQAKPWAWGTPHPSGCRWHRRALSRCDDQVHATTLVPSFWPRRNSTFPPARRRVPPRRGRRVNDEEAGTWGWRGETRRLFFIMAIPVVGLMRNTRAVSRMPLPLRAIATTWRRISSIRPRSWEWRRKIRRSHCLFWHW